jgi:UDP-N-acetylmuramoyl-L-alanyl-D-glutamate--2,6-diaminopimelate ligase
MKLAQLLSLFPQLKWGDAANSEVTEVTQDSRTVKPGAVFVAVRGASGDGHQHLASAAAQGAIALIVEDDKNIPAGYKGAVVRAASSRQALDQIAQRFFGDPAKQLFCVGVTGTNGKTTITYMIEAIFSKFGWPTGVLGTIDHHLGDRKWPSALTTPDALTLQRRLKEFVSLGAQAAAFEVSSHALTQHRADSLPFAVGIFTNFTRDHLDYHKTMEEYFSAKERLFTELLGRHPSVNAAVLNADDPAIRNVRVREGVTTWWYGRGEDHPADFSFRPLKEDLEGTLFHLSTPRGNAEFHLPCTGLHNVYNAVAAVAAALAAGVSLQTAQEALSQFRGAPGRLERVRNARGLNIFVDYAHTDDALATVLRALSEVRARSPGKKGRIITVFGCGGDRDKGKRPLMAKAAAQYSDALVITSDNPRSEDPLKIIDDIRAGVPREWKGDLKVEPDRRAALSLSLQMGAEGDVILIAGKGHEDYQIIGDRKLNFSDTGVVTELLNE